VDIVSYLTSATQRALRVVQRGVSGK